MLKYLLDEMQIDILNIELYRVHREWNHNNVSSPYTRIYLITDGYGLLTINGNQYTLEPGNAYIIPAFTLVDMECPESFEHYYIHLTAHLPDGLNLFSLVECDYKIPLSSEGIHLWHFQRLLQLNPGLELIERDAKKPIYKSMLERCERLNETRSARELIESNGLIRLLLAAFIKPEKQAASHSSFLGYHRFQKVFKYIQQNLHKEFSLTDLAGIMDLNPAYFSSLFTQTMGISPIDFVNKRRIESAQRLLLGTHKTLKEIAAQTGFKDVYYFSRMFKKIAGIPPAGYRKRLFDL